MTIFNIRVFLCDSCMSKSYLLVFYRNCSFKMIFSEHGKMYSFISLVISEITKLKNCSSVMYILGDDLCAFRATVLEQLV